MTARLLALLALITGLFAADLAHAQDAPAARPSASVSWSVWSVSGPTVRLRFMAPSAEAEALVPGDGALAQAILKDLTVTSAAGDCPAIDQGQGLGQVYAMALTPGLDRFELVFVCPSASAVMLHDRLFFDKRPAHVNYALVLAGSAPPTVEMFTRSNPSAALPSRGAGPLRFVLKGAVSLLLRLDVLCALAALLLLVRGWRDLGWTTGGLALGTIAAVALSLAGLAPARANADAASLGLIAAILGLTALKAADAAPAGKGWKIAARAAFAIAAIGATAFAAWKDPMGGQAVAGLSLFAWALAGRGSPPPAWRLWAPALMVGLLLGMDLTGDLRPLALSPSTLAAPLIAYDIGRLVLACALLAGASALLRLAGRRLTSGRSRAALDTCGSALVGLGVFLFVSLINA